MAVQRAAGEVRDGFARVFSGSIDCSDRKYGKDICLLCHLCTHHFD